MTWRPKWSMGAVLGLALIGLVLFIDSWLLRAVLHRPVDGWTFLFGLGVLFSLPMLGVMAYWTAGALTLRYRLNRNAIIIIWAGTQQIIPLTAIQRIVPGTEIPGQVVRRRGLWWPGNYVGWGMVPGLGRTRFFASQPLHQQLLLVTPGVAYGISPRDTDGFQAAFAARRALGPNKRLRHRTRYARWLTRPLWQDRTARLLVGLAVGLNLALFGFLCLRFPRLPPVLALHFNAAGLPDRSGPKHEAFSLPIIGLIILGTNLVLGLLLYRRERAGTYLLWGAAAAAQSLFWLAALSLVA
jgi:hypothetical protein